MTRKERLSLILLLGLIVLGGLTINQTFRVLTPPPESPEMARAKAEALLMKTEARLQDQHLYRMFLIGTGIILAGVVVCFGSLLVALRLIQVMLRLNSAFGHAQSASPVRYEE
jgi:hypothetical protein